MAVQLYFHLEVPVGEGSKSQTLREEGTLNPRPEGVVVPIFRENEFFDARDLVQVKYEMLRRVREDDVSVTQAAAEFGFSRPTFYEAQKSYDHGGIAALVPKKRGPRGPHKLRPEVVDFLRARVQSGAPIRARFLAREVAQTFGLELHPRTIERALGSEKKSGG